VSLRALPLLGAGLVDLVDLKGRLGVALRERIQPGAENDVLPDSVGGLFAHEVVEEAGASPTRLMNAG
jgi:hypothetical protein